MMSPLTLSTLRKKRPAAACYKAKRQRQRKNLNKKAFALGVVI
jgi:hypothetical protein